MSGKGKAPSSGKGKGKADDGELSAAIRVRCRHILCEKQGKLMEAVKHLQGFTETKPDGTTITQPPMRFNQVAEMFSEDKAKDGGNLGWRTRQDVVGPFADVAFSLSVGRVSEPFKTRHGWHVVLVEERSNK